MARDPEFAAQQLDIDLRVGGRGLGLEAGLLVFRCFSSQNSPFTFDAAIYRWAAFMPEVFWGFKRYMLNR